MIAIRRRLSLLAVTLVALTLALVVPGTAVRAAPLQIDITKGNVDPIPIAVSNFQLGVALNQNLGQEMAQVIGADLARSGLFEVLDQRVFVSQPKSFTVQPRFADWRLINAQALVTGQVTQATDGRLRVAFRLWDTFGGQQLAGVAYVTPLSNWRRVAHKIADKIYERLTGETGYFDTRIVYVAESGPKNARIKRLAIMDQDGYNHQFLTDGRDLVLTPRFSPTLQEITYLAYVNDKPRVYLYDITSGRREILGDFPGMTFAPRFSPDGNGLVMSMEINGNSDIYFMDLRTRQVTRLTSGPSIETSPSFSPDGSKIVFNSDQGGSPQLYVMNLNGTDVHRISFGGGVYNTPVWSPRGDLIAFTKQAGGQFHIGVMKTDGTGERMLSASFLDEGPTWAPNGRVLLFFRQTPSDARGLGGKVKVWSVDLTGYNERQVLTPGDGSDPAWSPLIP